MRPLSVALAKRRTIVLPIRYRASSTVSLGSSWRMRCAMGWWSGTIGAEPAMRLIPIGSVHCALFDLFRQFCPSPATPFIDAVDQHAQKREHEGDVDDQPEKTANIHASEDRSFPRAASTIPNRQFQGPGSGSDRRLKEEQSHVQPVELRSFVEVRSPS